MNCALYACKDRPLLPGRHSASPSAGYDATPGVCQGVVRRFMAASLIFRDADFGFWFKPDGPAGIAKLRVFALTSASGFCVMCILWHRELARFASVLRRSWPAGGARARGDAKANGCADARRIYNWRKDFTQPEHLFFGGKSPCLASPGGYCRFENRPREGLSLAEARAGLYEAR